MKNLRSIFKVLVSLSGVIIIIIVLFLVFAAITDYSPLPQEQLVIQNPQINTGLKDRTIDIMIWNIGYAGLGKEMDFFYDGGKMVRPLREDGTRYLDGILKFINGNDTLDMIMLQEVDQSSDRSYRTNQLQEISQRLPHYNYVFAKNYDVRFVPVPLLSPMGKVTSGIMNLSKYQPVSSFRISFEGNYSWPTSLFMLDRCFIIQRYKVSDTVQLVLINTHNSAFDDGELREAQMRFLKETALQEAEKGNYVVIGGDWNQNPPGFNPGQVTNGDVAGLNDFGNIPFDLFPSGWQWVFDASTPTNRSVDKPYHRGVSTTTVIDFFLLSPNLKPVKIRTVDLGFECTDHNPVILLLTMD